ncbi:ribosomal protein 63, mitochondrial [Nylanderia fulva]|uniref:ribosomal protein 63, mitochondrial n=1 Tax=Nylanderia fulva TaxID=613905 RepID=UPI0010FB8D63|nr:ribosomal protein 63, mitochondrial [Nylanderia fulva]
MRLGLVLLHLAKPKLQYKFRGKYRKVKKPSIHDLMDMKKDFEREEQNMLILRHPYLTIEQSHGHMKHIEKDKMFFDKFQESRKQEFEKTITIAERLAHLRVTEQWD